jgi:hypothetical protein
MTLQQAKSIARHLGLTLRKVRSGDYRVNFRDETKRRLTTRTIWRMPSKPQLRGPYPRCHAGRRRSRPTEPLQGRITDMPLNPKATPPEVEE